MYKTWLAIGLMALTFSSPALADTYSGTTVAARSISIEAPASGTLRAISASPGSEVGSDSVLGEIATTRVFATQDGIVASISAAEGVQSEGAVMEIYPLEQYQVYCTVNEAYQSAASTLVHSGERVYMMCTENGTHRGMGIITMIDGDEYRVLATGGEFYVGETVYIYRDADFSDEQRIGIGTVVANDAQAYESEGVVASIHVSEGEYVERGELLYEYSDSVERDIMASTDGIVTEVLASQGERVKKGDTVMTLVSYDDICIEISVDSTAAASICVGDKADIALAMYEAGAGESFTGTVISISGIAQSGMYAVRIRPDDELKLMLGMTAEVSIG